MGIKDPRIAPIINIDYKEARADRTTPREGEPGKEESAVDTDRGTEPQPLTEYAVSARDAQEAPDIDIVGEQEARKQPIKL